MKINKNPAIVAAIASAFSSSLVAAPADAELGQIVVTATRQATRADELMADITVIDRQEIEQAGQTTIEQLLSQQPGIQFTANGGPGTNSGVFIRGASPKQSIVLIDGQRFGSATTGDATFSRIPLSQVDRIEILRGPASSLYGADAIGGVIQIFTKRGDGETRFNASTGYGTYNTSDTRLGISGGNEVVSFSLQGGYYETEGVSSLHDRRNRAYNPDRDGYRNTSFSGNFSVRPASGHEVGASFLTTDGTSGYDSGFSAAAARRDYKSQQEVATHSIYSRNKLHQNWTSTLRIGRSTDDLTTLRDGVSTGEFRTAQDQFVWQNDIKLPVGSALLAAEYLKQTVDGTTNYTEDERTIRSLLAGWTAGLGNHRVQLNLCHDDNSQFGGKTTGAGTYGYQLSDTWRAHLSYGTAFRAPTFNELYFPDTGFGGGNPNLKPEESRNAETGLIWEHGGQRLSAVYFHNRVKNLINSWPPQNVDSATLKGISFAYAIRTVTWSGGVSVDLQRPRDDDTDNHLARRADKQMFTHLSRSFGDFTLGGEWQLVGQRYDDAANRIKLGGYGLVNLFAEYRIEKDWVLFARGNNIFDKYYETANQYGVLGANVFAGVRYAPK